MAAIQDFEITNCQNAIIYRLKSSLILYPQVIVEGKTKGNDTKTKALAFMNSNGKRKLSISSNGTSFLANRVSCRVSAVVLA